MKKTFLSGLAALLPLAITFFIIRILFDLLTDPFVDIVESLLDDGTLNKTLLYFLSRILILLALVTLTLILGLLGKHFIVRLFDKFMRKIPIVKTIYQATADLSKNFFSQSSTYFEKRVLVKFPHNKALALGLQAGRVPNATKLGNEYKSVFVPTSPHPVSGFLMMMSDSEIKEIDLTTEDLFTILISCGIHEPK